MGKEENLADSEAVMTDLVAELERVVVAVTALMVVGQEENAALVS
jgi:hypothetical protein